MISPCLNRKPEELFGEKELSSASVQRISVMFGLNLGKLHSQRTRGLMASERAHIHRRVCACLACKAKAAA